MLLEKIKKEILEARKSRDSVKANLLNTLYSEAKTQAINSGEREPSDELLMKVLKKFHKNLKETIALKEKNSSDTTQDKKELEILESFLPKQLSDEELEKIIKKFIDEEEEKSMKIMGKIMGRLKKEYDGRFDGKKASEITRKLLS